MSKNPFPVRMCSGCMRRFPKNELTRIVRTEDGKAIIDNEYKLPGRGAYICIDATCIKKAEKKNWFSRSLKGEVDKKIYTELYNLAKGERLYE